jgi:uncharacterized protein (DUF2147 family)
MRALTIALTVVFCSVLGFGASAAEPTAIGLWQQVDDKTGEVGGWFLLFEKDGAYQGALVKSFPKPGEDPNPLCKKCEGDQKNAPSLGLVLIKGMKRNGLKYDKGTILDPRDGKVYNAFLEVSPDGKKLRVHGYFGLEVLGRSQFWNRLPQEAISEVDPAIVMTYAPGLLPQSPQKTGTTSPHQRSATPGKEKTADLPTDQKAIDAPAQKAAEAPERKTVDGPTQRVIDAHAQRAAEPLPKKAPLPPERPKQ